MINPGDEPERRTPFPGPNARQRPQPYKFSAEELRVLRECNRESFYQRCIPMGTLLGGITYYGVQTGFLTKNQRFGAFPKVSVAVIMGYFLGKFSYHKKCAEKFMALPDSKIGRIMKARRLGIPDEEIDQPLPAFPMSPFSGITDSYSDKTDSNRNYDYDSRPNPEGLDDSFRPSLDNPIVLHEEEMPPEQKHVTTYEELRRKNREEYEQIKLKHYKQLNPQAPSPSQPSGTARESESGARSSTTGPKNKYGDTWG